MTADKKRLVARILSISSVVLLGLNVVLYARGRGHSILLALGALCLILGMAINASAKRGE